MRPVSAVAFIYRDMIHITIARGTSLKRCGCHVSED